MLVEGRNVLDTRTSVVPAQAFFSCCRNAAVLSCTSRKQLISTVHTSIAMEKRHNIGVDL